MEELPVCSRPADEGSLMSKENIFEDFEDVYDTKPWEDVPEKWAADGVIITTRKGKKGEKVKIDFSANLTAQFYTSQSTMDLCNSAEYATAMAQAALNDGLDPVAYASNYGLNLNASQGIGIQAYDLSVSNATDKYSALFSLGYKKNNGILKNGNLIPHWKNIETCFLTDGKSSSSQLKNMLLLLFFIIQWYKRGTAYEGWWRVMKGEG